MMKQVLGYQGNLITLDVPQPIVGPFDVKVKVLYSVFSSGTEGTRIKSQRRSSFLSKASSYKAILSKLRGRQFTEIIARYRKFKGFYAPLGYSCIGEVVELGSEVAKNYKIGDIVAAGGEYAMHAEYVSVPQGLTHILVDPDNLKLPQLAMAYLSTIPINSCSQLLHDDPSEILIIGGGLIGTLASLYFAYNGKRNTVLDPDECCLASNISNVDLINDIKNTNVKYEGVLITTGSLTDFSEVIPHLEKECMVNILGEITLNALDKGQLEELYSKVTFCNSFGHGRRDPNFEIKGNEIPKKLSSTYTISDNIQRAINFLENIDITGLCYQISVDYDELLTNAAKINVFKYGSHR